MENGFRNKETLTRKDMVFGAINVLATEDKRSLKGADRLAYGLSTAQTLYECVQNRDISNGAYEQKPSGSSLLTVNGPCEMKSLVTEDGVEIQTCAGCNSTRFASEALLR